MKTSYTLTLSDHQATLENVGGKGMSLAKMLGAGFPVPNGFHISTEAYRAFVDANNLQTHILAALKDADPSLPASLEIASATISRFFAGDMFNPKLLSAKDQEDIRELNFPGELLLSVLAWSTAMLDWGTVTPADLLCPTLWLIGSENEKAMESFKEYEKEIPGSNVQVCIIEGLNHAQEFNHIEQVLPVILDFVRGWAK